MNYFELILEFDSEEEAEIIYKSIFLEHISSQIKSKATMDRNKNVIKINVEAEDISILKASIYSYLRWIGVAQNIYNICKE
ncbi:KEOPS complex subunit Pcc1 [Methanocaldococcus sp.]|uniref:KEOPS complex subunit Pcc1 n=1 Tax=Methanocaldococcus sp. TaxID=2152917 RepID=UPI00260AD475|nr:KEOPS complex subunit Pcc1 [Methanocaldococcus sp.]MCQ6253461.1 KEOPS complex Pcc1-like subunit [Methanocaldococcus sp.]